MNMKRRQLLMWGLGFSVVLLTVAWMSLRSDTLSDTRASFMTMLQALSAARESASKCWSDRHIAVVDCEAVKRLMPTPPSSEVAYMVTDQGVLVGIDYSNRVTVLLTPRVDGSELNWRCAGTPSEAITKLCNDLTTMKR